MIEQVADIAGVILGTEMAHAAKTTALTLEQPFEGKGSFVDWAEWTTAGLAILTLAVVITTLFFGRRRLSPLRRFS